MTAEIHVVLPERSEDSISESLRELTRQICLKTDDSGAGGLGGEYGYGSDFENDIFMMHRYCYTPDTFVFTKKGFVPFDKIKKDDIFLSVNPSDHKLKWNKASYNIKKYFKGNLKNFIGKSIDLLVTPEHKIFVKNYKKQFEFKDIDKLTHNDSFSIDCIWEGEDKNISIGKHNLTSVQFAKFMGYYLSEGSCMKRGEQWYQISIAQSNQKNQELIAKDLYEMGFSISKNKWQIYINKNTSFAEYLYQFGKSYQKYCPKEIKEMSKNTIDVFLNAYILGDGSIQKGTKFKKGIFHDFKTIYTSSSKMSNDLIELTIKAGYRPSVWIDKSAGNSVRHKNGIYKTNHNIYHIRLCRRKQTYIKNIKIVDVPYDGYVYDVVLPEDHTLLVMREGKIWWGSNCWCESEDCKWCNEEEPNFLYKPTKASISWYKYIGRGQEIDGKLQEDWFEKCLQSLWEKDNCWIEFNKNFDNNGSIILCFSPFDKDAIVEISLSEFNPMHSVYCWDANTFFNTLVEIEYDQDKYYNVKRLRQEYPQMDKKINELALKHNQEMIDWHQKRIEIIQNNNG